MVKKRKVQLDFNQLYSSIEDDIKKILDSFERLGSLSFKDFNSVWIEYDFVIIFGFGSHQFPIQNIIKHVYNFLFKELKARNYEVGIVGVIFFIYHVYYSQPCIEDNESISLPIPIGEESFKRLKNFYTTITCNKEARFNEVAYALYRLLTGNAFQLVDVDIESLYGGGANFENIQNFRFGEILNNNNNNSSSSRSLDRQLDQIRESFLRDDIMAGNLQKLYNLSVEYQGLAFNSPMTSNDQMKYTETTSEMQRIWAEYYREQRKLDSLTNLDRDNKGKGREKIGKPYRSRMERNSDAGSISINHNLAGNNRRKSTNTSLIPSRPSTAPPDLHSHSVSMPDALNYLTVDPNFAFEKIFHESTASDMPDFSQYFDGSLNDAGHHHSK